MVLDLLWCTLLSEVALRLQSSGFLCSSLTLFSTMFCFPDLSVLSLRRTWERPRVDVAIAMLLLTQAFEEWLYLQL